MFMFTRYGICCVLAIFERRRGGLGSKISGCDQLAEVAVYFAMSGLPPEERAGWVRRSRNPPTGLRRCDGFRFRLRSASYGGQVALPILRPLSTSLRSNGSRECAPDDRLGESIQF